MTAVIKGVLKSRLLQREIPYRVVLPENYASSTKNYPVLYLLHGLFGCCDNWLDLTGLKNYALDKELIIVLPEGGDSWYTNSATSENDKFESYFIHELIPEIDLLYKTIKKREKRAVGGLSMGGYGALKFACKRPDLFCFAASLSGAFEAPQLSEKNPGADWENLGPSIEKAFGGENSPTRIENDVFQIIRRIPLAETKQFPHFYIACGSADGFLQSNRELVELLKTKNFSLQYREASGGHDWDYWDKETERILLIFESKLT